MALKTLVGSRVNKIGELRCWLDGTFVDLATATGILGFFGGRRERLAVALLFQCGWSDEAVLAYYKAFEFEFIEKLIDTEFTLTFDPEKWFEEKRADALNNAGTS